MFFHHAIFLLQNCHSSRDDHRDMVVMETIRYASVKRGDLHLNFANIEPNIEKLPITTITLNDG